MATITVNAGTTYQTMGGWEATQQSGQFLGVFSSYADYMFGQAVSDLGINRLRAEMKTTQTGTQSTFDYAGWFDPKMSAIVMPLRSKLLAQGETLWLNVCYVYRSTSDGPLTTASTYATAVLGAYQHMQSTYGFLPDSWEVVLEPDTFGWPNATALGNALVAAGNALVAGGFTPYFVVPSCTSLTSALSWWNTMVAAVPAVLSSGYVKEFSYHRYQATPTTIELQNVATICATNGLTSGMLESIGANYAHLHDDLTLANVSNWEQYVLAAAVPTDNGAQYYWIDNTAGTPQTQARVASRTKFLRQYFKFIRRGATRIAATTNAAGTFDATAFINPSGNYVVVVKTTTSGSITINGLPNSTYSIKYTTAAAYDVNLASQTISGGSLTTSIPAAGVLTVYGSAVRVPISLTVASAPGVDLPDGDDADVINGNYFVNSGREVVEVTNGGGSAITVTFETAAVLRIGFAQYPVADLAVSVAAGATKIFGPFDKVLFNDTQGRMRVNWSSGSSVTARVISLGTG